jgi:AcrR family transcriptional regulator
MVTCEDGLRARKKRQTREDLHRAALDLVEDKGLAAVTTEEIAARAGVSPRTFFNYFPSKDAAVLGQRPEDLDELSALLEGRPAGEEPLETLHAVILAILAPASFDPKLRAQRRRVLLNEPSLAPAFVGGNLRVENALTAAIEQRLGLAAGADLRVRVMVAASLAAVRACLEHHQAGAPGDVEESIDRGFAMLAEGFAAAPVRS